MQAMHGSAMHGRLTQSGTHLAPGLAARHLHGPPRPSRCSRCRRSLVKPRVKQGDEKADPNKADFSAYWSLKFKEFFSKRRQYLDLARKRKEDPEIIKKLDAQIKFLQERLEQQQIERRKATDKEEAEYYQQVEVALKNLDAAIAGQEEALRQEALQEARALSKYLPGYDPDQPPRYPTGPQDNRDLLANDVDLAVGHLRTTRTKVLTLAPIQLRAAVKALLLAPFTVTGALFSKWQELFAGQRYENFLMAEGERVWYWRNRTENERWFWEEFVFDRFLIPLVWTLCYLAIVPNNLLWAVVIPFSLMTWQNGQVPSPANMEWWLIMVFGLYGKCWDQVLAALAFLFKWC